MPQSIYRRIDCTINNKGGCTGHRRPNVCRGTSTQIQEMMHMKMPFAFAALDGCHVPIKCPSDIAGRRDHHNSKNFYSIILTAMVDWKGRFIWAQAGMPGNVHDSSPRASGTHYRRSVACTAPPLQPAVFPA